MSFASCHLKPIRGSSEEKLVYHLAFLVEPADEAAGSSPSSATRSEGEKRLHRTFILKSCGSSVTCHWRPALTEIGHASTDAEDQKKNEDGDNRCARVQSRAFLTSRTVAVSVAKYRAVRYGTIIIVCVEH